MKYPLLFLYLFATISSIALGQAHQSQEKIIITANNQEIIVRANDRGELEIHISSDDLRKLEEKGQVRYRDFGAKGDGKTEDIEAIAAAHAFANQAGLTVKADEGAVYYIGGKARTAVIQTDTDFG